MSSNKGRVLYKVWRWLTRLPSRRAVCGDVWWRRSSHRVSSHTWTRLQTPPLLCVPAPRTHSGTATAWRPGQPASVHQMERLVIMTTTKNMKKGETWRLVQPSSKKMTHLDLKYIILNTRTSCVIYANIVFEQQSLVNIQPCLKRWHFDSCRGWTSDSCVLKWSPESFGRKPGSVKAIFRKKARKCGGSKWQSMMKKKKKQVHVIIIENLFDKVINRFTFGGRKASSSSSSDDSRLCFNLRRVWPLVTQEAEPTQNLLVVWLQSY